MSATKLRLATAVLVAMTVASLGVFALLYRL